MSSLLTEHQSQINLGAADDSQSPFFETMTTHKAPEIIMNDVKNENYVRERGITGLDLEVMNL